jgi:hypothetical protein
MTKLRNWLLLIAALLGIGAAAGWYLSRPAVVTEPPAPELRQIDGSLVLARAATVRKARMAAAVPRGGQVEREISVTVEPTPAAGTGLKLPGRAEPCPPVSVDLSLVRMPDDTRRVVASSPDGEVVGGLDVPIEPIISVAPRNRSAGLSYDPIKQTPGLWVEQDFGRLRVGLDLNQTRVRIGGETGVEARVRVGWSW